MSAHPVATDPIHADSLFDVSKYAVHSEKSIPVENRHPRVRTCIQKPDKTTSHPHPPSNAG